MKSYMHADSASNPPTLSGEALAIYRAIRAGVPVTIRADHYTPEALALIAERLRCDEVTAALVRVGVNARVIDHESEGVVYVEAAVRIWVNGDGAMPLHAMDAEAAVRVLQRVEAGLGEAEALTRTFEQCEAPVLSGHALRVMERESDAALRRINREAARDL